MKHVSFLPWLLALAACPSAPPVDGTEGSSDTTSAPPASTTSTTISADESTSTTAALDSTTSTSESSSSEAGDTIAPPDDTTGEPPVVGGYNDCSKCGVVGEGCIASTFADVCSLQGCNDDSDCPVPDFPSEAPVSCDTFSPSASCILDCQSDPCPDGMMCIFADGGAGFAYLCAWPTQPPGGGACPDEDIGSRVPTSFPGNSNGLGNDVLPLCAVAGGGTDALVRWTAPADGTYTFDTEGSSFDTILAVLDGCPADGGEQLACNDDTAVVGGPSEVTLNLVAGQSVILVVDSYNGATGPYVINVQ